MMPPFEPSSEDIEKTYATFGLAVFLCQCIETHLSYSLLAYGKLTGEVVTVEQYDAMERDIQKLTMGKMLRKVREVAQFDEHAEEILLRALEKRNFLIHHYFRERAYDWYQEAAFSKMTKELADLVEQFSLANSFVETMYRALAKACGVTDEMTQQQMRELLESAGKA